LGLKRLGLKPMPARLLRLPPGLASAATLLAGTLPSISWSPASSTIAPTDFSYPYT
jgi:hypothetical protein